jgi:uncharacterized protein (DUF362 family)
MDRREFLKTLAAAGALVTVKSSGMMDVMASTVPSGSQAAAADNADLAAVMNGEPAQMLEAAMKELGGIERFIKKGDKIVIKPNIGWDRTPELAGNTNPDLISALIKMCQDAGAAEIKVFDHTCDNWSRCYDHSGIEAAVKKAGATMVYGHEQSSYEKVEIPNGKTLKNAQVHKAIIECDKWINVPVLKNHGGALMTCAMKNHMGIVWDRRAFHSRGLHQCIADICTYKPAVLHIVDAYRTVATNGPQGRSANDVVLTKALFASPDIVAVDTAAGKFFTGINKNIKFEDIEHIPDGQKLGLGTMDLESINVKRIKL